MNQYTCPVCGFGMEDPPSDYNICPSCGTEFGHHDVNASIESLRAEWLRRGAHWWSTVDARPDNWDPYGQVSVLFQGGTPWIGSGLRRMISGGEDCHQEDVPKRTGLGSAQSASMAA
jgi:hypothetical protein